LRGGFIVGGVLRAARSRHRSVPVSAFPSAIALTIRTRKGDVPAAVILAAAIVSVIRLRAANQFRKSGILLISQPGIAQKR